MAYGLLREYAPVGDGRVRTIHNAFRELYEPGANAAFAIEIEFKITADGRLAIKKGRPWVLLTAG